MIRIKVRVRVRFSLFYSELLPAVTLHTLNKVKCNLRNLLIIFPMIIFRQVKEEVSFTMIDLRRKLLIMYVIKRIMKFKYKNRKKRALFLSINSIKTYLQRKQVFASMIRSILFEMNIRRRRSVWVYQREEIWFDSMLNDQNFDQHWRSYFRMSQDISRHSESCSTSIGKERYSVSACNNYSKAS